jgi:hypothetical protein
MDGTGLSFFKVMKIYHIFGAQYDKNGEVYGWTTYSYMPNRQPDKKYIHVKRLGKINTGNFKIDRRAFQLDPIFDKKKHDNMCHMCYFTSTEKLVEFLRTGLETMHQDMYDDTMKMCKKLHPRKIAPTTKSEKANVG